jgi:hypothetical protein
MEMDGIIIVRNGKQIGVAHTPVEARDVGTGGGLREVFKRAGRRQQTGRDRGWFRLDEQSLSTGSRRTRLDIKREQPASSGTATAAPPAGARAGRRKDGHEARFPSDAGHSLRRAGRRGRRGRPKYKKNRGKRGREGEAEGKESRRRRRIQDAVGCSRQSQPSGREQQREAHAQESENMRAASQTGPTAGLDWTGLGSGGHRPSNASQPARRAATEKEVVEVEVGLEGKDAGHARLESVTHARASRGLG